MMVEKLTHTVSFYRAPQGGAQAIVFFQAIVPSYPRSVLTTLLASSISEFGQLT